MKSAISPYNLRGPQNFEVAIKLKNLLININFESLTFHHIVQRSGVVEASSGLPVGFSAGEADLFSVPS